MTKSSVLFSPASRREFVRRAGVLSALGVGAPIALNLAAMGAASAQSRSDDYRALVCLFMVGGNDNHNTVIPFDLLNHGRYQQSRPGLAIARAQLKATELVPDNPWPGSRRMALHPSLAPLKSLFDQGAVGLAMNLGPLVHQGTTLQDFWRGIDLPPKLFLHREQQSVWATSLAEGASTGWGGQLGDLLAADNGGAATFTSISAAGNALFMSGDGVLHYRVGTNGVMPVNKSSGSAQVTATINNLVLPAPDTFPQTSLGAQLRFVARVIAARQPLGVRHQVFFVAQDGFDTHANQLETHARLLTTTAQAMQAFHQATVAMNVNRQVTTFTGSEFGRTLSSTGDGSDHGWGSHHFVMGGTVEPRSWVGEMPEVSVSEGPDNVGRGRLLPAIGIDQFGATLGHWLGVEPSALPTVFPNLANYSVRNLGFMR